MSNKRLVAFLGTGNYNPTRYEIDGTVSKQTSLVACAICEVLDVNSVVILGTSEAEEKWIQTGAIQQELGPNRRFHFRPVPKGATPQERWKLFQTVLDAVTLEPIRENGEQDQPDEIIVDVTHGYRSQPLFAVAAVNFALSDWKRVGRQSERLPNLRLLYGAWDARDPATNVAPVWDLTEFLTVAQWNSALDALMRFGRADDIADLGKRESRRRIQAAMAQGIQGEGLKKFHTLREFGEAAKQLADDLATARVKSLFTESAPKLRDLLSRQHGQIVQDMPPLQASLSQLQDWLKDLCAPNVLGKEGLRATARLAKLYGKLQRFAEQAAVLREGLITHYALEKKLGPVPEPGQKGCKQARANVERDWQECFISLREGNQQLGGRLRDNAKCSKAVVDIRNDIEHCGINDQPLSSSDLREKLEKRVQEFEKLVEEFVSSGESEA